MPIVSEASPGEFRADSVPTSYQWTRYQLGKYQASGSGGNVRHFSYTTASKSQVGWRSRPQDGEPVESTATGAEYVPLGRTRSYIARLDAIESMTSGSAPRKGNFVVHDRDYTERSLSGHFCVAGPFSFTASQNDTVYEVSGNAAVALTWPAPPSQRHFSKDGVTEGDVGQRLRGVRPTKPHAGLATFLGELGDLPKSVSTLLANARLQKLRDAPINAQFGVIPAVSDIRALATAVKNSQRYVRQFVRDSGEIVRRSNQWTTIDEAYPISSYGRHGIVSPPGVQLEVKARGQRTHTVTHHVGAWFQYYVADPDGFTGRVKRYDQLADHLLGMKIKPSTFWELTPWSWLVDWSLDIGGLLAYQEDVRDDSLVARGGFHTVRETWTDSYECVWSFARSGSWVPSGSVPPSVTVGRVSQKLVRRRSASPYAWSADAAVTPRRAAILASLGLSKGALPPR